MGKPTITWPCPTVDSCIFLRDFKKAQHRSMLMILYLAVTNYGLSCLNSTHNNTVSIFLFIPRQHVSMERQILVCFCFTGLCVFLFYYYFFSFSGFKWFWCSLPSVAGGLIKVFFHLMGLWMVFTYLLNKHWLNFHFYVVGFVIIMVYIVTLCSSKENKKRR